MIMTKKEVKRRVLIALRRLYKDDHDLLDVWAHERSLTHKLAEYLQQEFPAWNVDCEYNRFNNEPKRLTEIRKKVLSDDLESRTVYPDIIVHKRRRPENLLVIEVKKSKPSGNLETDEHDEKKLMRFTEIDEFLYEYALYILLDKNEPLSIFLYRDGERTGEDWAQEF